jgi:hypothetical protein
MKCNGKETTATVREERRHAESAIEAQAAKCFEIISKIVALKDELREMSEEANPYEVAAMCRADREIMAKLHRAEAEYMFPFPRDWRERRRFRGRPEPTPEPELSADELDWRSELDAAISDLVETFAPAGMRMVAARGSDDWVAELREHVQHVYGVFGESDEDAGDETATK